MALVGSGVVGRGWRAVAVTTAMSSANARSVVRRGYGATLISGHLVHAGNHRHGSAGHRQGQCSTQYAVVCEKPMAFGQGVVVTRG